MCPRTKFIIVIILYLHINVELSYVSAVVDMSEILIVSQDLGSWKAKFETVRSD